MRRAFFFGAEEKAPTVVAGVQKEGPWQSFTGQKAGRVELRAESPRSPRGVPIGRGKNGI